MKPSLVESLERGKTTAAQAIQLEDTKEHPLREGQRSVAYFDTLKFRRSLPVSAVRQEFLDKYHSTRVLILSGETGSGKTTQIPQFVFWDELNSGKIVACTQPRRLTATSMATRVAEEMDVPLGQLVGYKVRFEDMTTEETAIQYMTDRKLLQEAMKDSTFSKFSCIIVDEAHERTLATDILLALLKLAMRERDDLKVIIMSPTLNTEKFKNYYDDAESFAVAGRAYPVTIHYLATPAPLSLYYTFQTVLHIHKNMPNGDILVFVQTADEVERGCMELRLAAPDLAVLPLYSALPQGGREAVFRKYSKRKCIVATNFAETRLTIDGIVYVVDSGTAKHAGFNPRAAVETLLTGTISKASAEQRAGRAGRSQGGHCFRIYTKDTFENDFVEFNVPGILKTEFVPEVLLLKSMGHSKVSTFDFIDEPHREVFFRALMDLHAMRFIDENGSITDRGREALELPVHPVWYNAIQEGHALGCSDEMLTLAAIASAQGSLFTRPFGVRYVADAAMQRWMTPESDHLMLLNVFHAFHHENKRGALDMDRWCFDNFINRRVLDEVAEIRAQLLPIVTRLIGPLRVAPFGDEASITNFRKALARSFFHHTAYSDPSVNRGQFVTINTNYCAAVAPSSGLVGTPRKWVIYDKFTYSGRQYMQTVTAVDVDWLIDLEYFNDENLAQKRGNKGYRQPAVQRALEEARLARKQRDKKT